MHRINISRALSSKFHLLAAALLIAAVASPSFAHADQLGISSSQASVYDASTGMTTYASTGSCINQGGANACASYGFDSDVNVSTSAANDQPSAFAAYGFEITGPTNIAVPIIITGGIEANSTNGDYVGAVGLEVFHDNCCTVDALTFNTADPANGGFQVTVDWTSNFESLFFVETGCIVNSGGNCQSEIDPTIEIDPDWLASNPGYSLIVDPDEFPPSTSATPEPGSFLLLGSGLLGLAPLLRRRFTGQRRDRSH